MEQLTPLLEKLAAQLGTTTEYLWGVLIQQTQVELILCELWMGIWMWGVIIIISLAILALVLGAIVGELDEDVVAVFFCAIIIAIFIGGIGYYKNYSEAITLKTNPEYWALEQVLKEIK